MTVKKAEEMYREYNPNDGDIYESCRKGYEIMSKLFDAIKSLQSDKAELMEGLEQIRNSNSVRWIQYKSTELLKKYSPD